MELTEDTRYRLAYLTLRLALDRKLSATTDPSTFPGLLGFLDVLSGTQLAGQAGGKRYASQREKLESFLDAEFGEDILALVSRAVDELA